MKPAFTVVFLSLMLTTAGFAQQARTLAFGGFFRGGYASLSTANSLGQGVSPGKDHPFRTGFSTAGCELFFRYQRALVSVSVLGMGRAFRDEAGQPFDLTASTRHLKFGWVIHRNHWYAVYPVVGPGLSTVSLAQQKAGYTAVTHAFYYSTDVGIGADLAVNRSAETGRPQNRILLGVRLGCFVGAAVLQGQSAVGSGAGRPSGFYATLTVGAGTFLERRP